MADEIQIKLAQYRDEVGQYRLKLESAILGALILEKANQPAVFAILKPKNFTKDHQVIYRCIKEMVDHKFPVDLITVAHAVRPYSISAYTVAELTTHVNSAANMIYHAAILLELNIVEQFISTYLNHCEDDMIKGLGNDILQDLVVETQSLTVVEDTIKFFNQRFPEIGLTRELNELNQGMLDRFKAIRENVPKNMQVNG